MQEFLRNNKVSCNLMSLTGYRTLILLEALLESPKTIDEINECFKNNQYIKEMFSPDTLRIYINSLREVGCEITRANKSNGNKYILTKHPFGYEMSKDQLKAISKLYKNVYDKIDIRDLAALEYLLKKICLKLENKEAVEALHGILLLNRIDKDILHNLLLHCKNKNQITFLYNSPQSGKKKIELVADKLEFKSEKLYLWGNDLTHKSYSYFLVSRILEICDIKLIKSKEDFSAQKVFYEIYNHNDNYELESYEKIIEQNDSKLVIEADVKNEFSVMQRILYLANDCKVVYPESFKEKLLDKLKSMEKNYE
jgi:predicted DNA-binding transcriptional regulator YafY